MCSERSEELSDSLWRDWDEHRSVASRNVLIQYYLPWVTRIASILHHRYRSRETDRDDSIQNGVLGLVQAIERYDSKRGALFKTYAYPRVRGAIIDGIVKSFSLRPQLQEHIKEYIATESLSAAEYELEDWAGMMVDLVIMKLLEDSAASSAVEHTNPLELYVNYRQEKLVNSLVNQLDDLCRNIVLDYYRNQKTFNEIAISLGMSRSRVSQLHAVGIKKLRQLYEAYR